MRTVEQQKFMDGVHRFVENDIPRKEYLTLQGLPGTGKTAIITQIYKEFPNLNVLYAAFTGKAVDNLMAKGVKCDTLSSAFYNVKQGTASLEFELKTKLEEKWDVVIIDEFSQVTQQMVNDILSFGIKLIFVGDYGQLGPVSGEMTRYLQNADYVMSSIIRQSEDSGILRLAQQFRVTKKLPPYGRYAKDVLIVSKENITPEIILKSTQCICGTNDTRLYWNKQIRRTYGRKDYLPEVGERLISIKNMKQIRIGSRMLINGTTGTVKSVRDTTSDYFMMEFKPDWADTSVVCKVDKANFLGKNLNKNTPNAQFDWGYVITVNKAQGSEWDNVLFIVDMTFPPDALVQNINTGITRAKKKLVIAY